MIANHQMAYVTKIRSNASVIAIPLQYAVNWPSNFIRWASLSFTSQQAILEENAKLRARQLLLEARLQKLTAIEQENAQLRQLLSTSAHIDGKVLVAQLLSVNMDNFAQEAVIDRGRKYEVYQGQPVLDAYGVMGRIIRVDPYTSQVLLLTDTRSAIPVQNNRNGIRAIAAGLGYGDKLELLHVPDTSDIQAGDLLVTSGLGGNFPFGYPVGVVQSVDQSGGDGFAKIRVKASAHIEQSRQLILLWPPSDIPIKKEEAQPASQISLDQPVKHDENAKRVKQATG